MAKKNFKGGLDSLIENSLGMRKSGKRGEMKGNPIDLQPEQTSEPEDHDDKVSEKVEDAPKPQAATKTETAPRAESAPKAETAPVAEETIKKEEPKPQNETQIQPTEEQKNEQPSDPEPQKEEQPTAKAEVHETPEVIVETKIKAPTLEVESTDSEKNVYLKNLVADLRKELFLWRNGKLNVQNFNASLHAHGLKYNPENNEIEEI